MKIHTKLAKNISYGGKRPYKDIKYIVIHFTSGTKDTAKNNATYYATGNTRQAGAHFFVDKTGEVWKSININRIAWAVGGAKYSDECRNGGGKYNGFCTNYNSVSIELCALTGEAPWEQMKATRELVQYIQKKCPNAKTVIRHWDVNGKDCPAPFTGSGNEKWTEFKRFITAGYKFTAVVTKDAALRSKPKLGAVNKKGTAKKGTKVKIVKFNGNWGLTDNGYWISLEKVKEI